MVTVLSRWWVKFPGGVLCTVISSGSRLGFRDFLSLSVLPVHLVIPRGGHQTQSLSSNKATDSAEAHLSPLWGALAQANNSGEQTGPKLRELLITRTFLSPSMP